MSLTLPKPILIAATMISIVVGGGFGGAWEYSAYAVDHLKIFCNLEGGSISNPADEIVTVGVKNPSLVTVDGTWRWLFEGVNNTVPWSSIGDVSFHLPPGATSILTIRFPGLAAHVNSGFSSAIEVNVTRYVEIKTYNAGLRTFNYTRSLSNATALVPFSLGAQYYC